MFVCYYYRHSTKEVGILHTFIFKRKALVMSHFNEVVTTYQDRFAAQAQRAQEQADYAIQGAQDQLTNAVNGFHTDAVNFFGAWYTDLTNALGLFASDATHVISHLGF